MSYDYSDNAPTNQYPKDKVPDTMGYTPFAVMDDGDTICETCVLDPTNPVHDATVTTIPCPADTDGDGDCAFCARSKTPGRHQASQTPDGWGVAGWDHSGNTDEGVTCAHCNKEIC